MKKRVIYCLLCVVMLLAGCGGVTSDGRIGNTDKQAVDAESSLKPVEGDEASDLDSAAESRQSEEGNAAEHPLYECVKNILDSESGLRNGSVTGTEKELTIIYESLHQYSDKEYVTVKTTIRALDNVIPEDSLFQTAAYLKNQLPEMESFSEYVWVPSWPYTEVEREEDDFGKRYYMTRVSDRDYCFFTYKNRTYYSYSEYEQTPRKTIEERTLFNWNLYELENRVSIADWEGEDSLIQFAEEQIGERGILRLHFGKVGQMDVILVALRKSVETGEENSDEFPYCLFYEGEWESEIFEPSELTFTADIPYYGGPDFSEAKTDINFDGTPDLFLHLGVNGGSGGTFSYYHVFYWDEGRKEFVEDSSFPSHFNHIDLENQRVLCTWRAGAGLKGIDEYKLVNGVWMETRNLYWVSMADPDYKEPGDRELISELNYYEMGELIETTDITEMELFEIYDLYPDLDFWRRG